MIDRLIRLIYVIDLADSGHRDSKSMLKKSVLDPSSRVRLPSHEITGVKIESACLVAEIKNWVNSKSVSVLCLTFRTI